MSLASFVSTTSSVAAARRHEVFQDLPLLEKSTRLTVMELKNCDKQIVNELVYRWCRILTRPLKNKQMESLPGSMMTIDNSTQGYQRSAYPKKVLIIDLIGAFNPIRLGSILRRDEKRLRMISLVRGCKINSTYVTISSYLAKVPREDNSLKLVVIYQDEFFIYKTLEVLENFVRTTKCQTLLIVPRLGRREQDMLNLVSRNQLLRCDFTGDETQMNHVYFHRHHPNKSIPDKVTGELKEDGMHLHAPQETLNPAKKIKSI